MKYPIKIVPMYENGEVCYLAYLPAFGSSACSAIGDTVKEALRDLDLVKQDVIQHYKDTGRKLPATKESFNDIT